MIENLLSLYREKFEFKNFYDILQYNMQKYPQYMISNETFLHGYDPKTKISEDIPAVDTIAGDWRVDLPIWFNAPNSIYRIMIFGLEPRDTKRELNIERSNQYVFATPFAAERWLGKSKYLRAFADIISSDDTFIYITDVVKDYLVVSKEDKELNDLHARKNFISKAVEYRDFVAEEIDLIKPHMILALGNDSNFHLSKSFGTYYPIYKITHPSAHGDGASRCRNDVKYALTKFKSNSK